MLSKIWTFFFLLSFGCGLATGRLPDVTQAATMGAGEAVKLLLQIGGLMIFWSGIMEILVKAGICSGIARCLCPILCRIFGDARKDHKSMELVSANVTANLLGLSNAATPIGLQAAERLYRCAGGKGTPNDVLTLIILNTTSVQLIPATVAAIRAGFGAQNPFDVMPAIWAASGLSVCAALLTARLCRPFFPE